MGLGEQPSNREDYPCASFLVHPVSVLLLLLLLSVGVQPTSPVVEASDAAGFAATTLHADGEDGQEGPCW